MLADPTLTLHLSMLLQFYGFCLGLKHGSWFRQNGGVLGVGWEGRFARSSDLPPSTSYLSIVNVCKRRILVYINFDVKNIMKTNSMTLWPLCICFVTISPLVPSLLLNDYCDSVITILVRKFGEMKEHSLIKEHIAFLCLASCLLCTITAEGVHLL